jgi:hypothetical protein
LALDTLSEEAGSAEAPIKLLSETSEAHERGSVLVAAVFDAFVTIFERRTRDLFQIADATPGHAPLSPQLIKRLAEEAAHTADSVLQVCVRGLDYLPPVGPTFGEYLRAIITADTDLVPNDPLKYRVAFAEAFRKRGIPVPGVISYAPEALCWEHPTYGPDGKDDELAVGDSGRRGLFADALARLQLGIDFRPIESRSQSIGSDSAVQKKEMNAVEQELENSPYRTAANSLEDVRLNLREEAMRVVSYNQASLHNWLATPTAEAKDSSEDAKWERMLGIRMLPIVDSRPAPLSINSKPGHWDVPPGWADKVEFGNAASYTIPIFDVHSARIARRTGPNGTELHQLIAQITQRRRGYFDEEEQKRVDQNGSTDEPDFWFRGGATVIVDLRNAQVQRVIRKRIDDDDRLAEQRTYLLGDDLALAMVTDDCGAAQEPFAFMHGDEA